MTRNRPTIPPRRYRAPLLLIAAMLMMVSLLGRKEVVISHEGRVVQTARQMAASGWPWNAARVLVPAVSLQNDPNIGLHLAPAPNEPPIAVNPWLVPVMNGQIRLQKPPLPYWCAAVLFRCLGETETTARLVPAILGALCVLLVYDLGRHTIGERGGWYAGLAWISSYFIIDEFRKAMADPYLAYFTLAVVWAWVRITVTRERSANWMLVLFFYCCIALGWLAKGPLVLLHGSIAIAAYQICFRRRPVSAGIAHFLGIAFAVGMALPWFAYVKWHVPHAADIWRYESIGELSDNDENARAWWYYLPNLFQIALPWTPLWAIGIWTTISLLRRPAPSPGTPGEGRGGGSDSHLRSLESPLPNPPLEYQGRERNVRRRGARKIFPLAWYAVTIIFFSFVKLKKAAYLLPMMPAQALLVAQGLLFITAAARSRHGQTRGLGEAMRMTQTILGIGAAIALPILAFFTFRDRAIAAGIFSIPLFFIAWIPLRWLNRPTDWPGIQSVVYALLIGLLIDGLMAEKENQRSGKPAAMQLASLLAQPDTSTLPDRLAADVAVYMPLEVMTARPTPTLYVIVDDRRDAAKAEPQAFAPWVTYGKVTSVKLLPPPPDARRGSKRWKIFEIHVEPDAQ